VANRGTGRLEKYEYPRRSRIHLRNLGSNRSFRWDEGPRMPTLPSYRCFTTHIVSSGFVEELRSLLLPPTLAWTPARSLQPPSRRWRPRARGSARMTRGGGSGAMPTTLWRGSPAIIRGGSGFRRGAASPYSGERRRDGKRLDTLKADGDGDSPARAVNTTARAGKTRTLC
jgi:hypothetical protein